MRRICGFCDAPAVWRWKPVNSPAAYRQFMCDDHAAEIDLDELEDLGGTDEQLREIIR